LCTDYYLFIKY